ncbi:TPA: glycosyltransferase family 25 protein [Photobacterium damselae]
MSSDTMKVLLISLATSIERRSNAIQLLEKYNIEYEILDAVDGRLGEHSLLQRYNEKKFILHRGRIALPGELGCYASHFLAWKRTVELNQPLVVLEDDFILSNQFEFLIQQAEKLINQYGFIRIEPWRTKCFFSVVSSKNFKLVKFLKVPQCTTGYIISPSCAKHFMEASEEMILPVDVFIRNTYLHHQAIYGLDPCPIRPGNGKTSTIGNRKDKINSMNVKIKKSCFRLYTSFMTGITNIISR